MNAGMPCDLSQGLSLPQAGRSAYLPAFYRRRRTTPGDWSHGPSGNYHRVTTHGLDLYKHNRRRETKE